MVLQVHIGLQAFLGRPDVQGSQMEFDEQSEVVEPFSVETIMESGVEPSASGSYRCTQRLTAITLEAPALLGIVWLCKAGNLVVVKTGASVHSGLNIHHTGSSDVLEVPGCAEQGNF